MFKRLFCSNIVLLNLDFSTLLLSNTNPKEASTHSLSYHDSLNITAELIRFGYLSRSLSLSLYLCIYLFLVLTLPLSIYLSLFVTLPLSISLSQSTDLSIYLSIYLSFYLSLYLSIYIYIYIYLPACPHDNIFCSLASPAEHADLSH